MTRTEIIAQLDAEIDLLLRARDILAAPLSDFKNAPTRQAKTKVSAKTPKKPKQPAIAAAPAATAPQAKAVVAPPPEPVKEPQVRVVPPRRRMERRQLQTDKAGKSPAALSGLVPAGPVAVSADEARKVQERSAPPPTPLVEEVRSEIGSERSLGSLIQAFERRSGLSGIETPRS
jgi:hypothetical protein